MLLPKLQGAWLLLNGRKALWILVAWVACIVLHNATEAVLHGLGAGHVEEPVFFLLAVVVIPLYAISAALYTVFRMFVPK